MKRINLLLSLITASFILISACQKTIKVDEQLVINPDNISKYWKQFSVELTGDTMVLSKQNATLISDFSIKNFTFAADIYTTNGAEASLGFHTGPSGDPSIKGYSVLINNSDYRSGSPQKTGSLSRIRNNFVRVVPDNKWFPLSIEVKGNSVKVFVNQKLISDYIEPQNPLRIEGLENMNLSEGYLHLIKTTADGIIKIANMKITRHADDMAPAADLFVNDSTGEMLTLLNQQGFPVIDFHGHLKGGLTGSGNCTWKA